MTPLMHMHQGGYLGHHRNSSSQRALLQIAHIYPIQQYGSALHADSSQARQSKQCSLAELSRGDLLADQRSHA